MADLFDNLFDNLFNDKEFEKFNKVAKSIDLSNLKKTGNVSIVTTENEGVVTKTIEYTSFCGEYGFTSTISYFKENEKYEAIDKLNAEINDAVQSEDYLLAAKLKAEKEEILKN